MLIKGEDEFIVTEGKQKAARLQFLRSEDFGLEQNVLVITHTVVFEAYKGQGYGRQLLDALVDYARGNGYLIEPQCPFAKAIFEKTPEIQDVRA